MDAAVAHAEALAGDAADVGLTAGRSIERDVADDDVVLGHEGARARREHGELAAPEPLTPVVVGVAIQREGDAARHERAEALPGRAREVDAEHGARRPGAAPPLAHVVAKL